MLATLLACVVAVFFFMSIMFAVSLRERRFDVVDAAWGLVFIVIALTSFLLQPGELLEVDAPLIVSLLVIAWGLRLSWHITQRLKRSKEEDWRYQQMRQKWGKHAAIRAYFDIFLLQGILALVISTPVILVNLFGGGVLGLPTLLGIGVWLLGFLFESIGDSQLKQFLSGPENKGKIMDRGLWRYTRHPNYFGEIAQWWGIFIIALGVPYGWIGLAGPLVITFLLLFVSGIPLTEKRFEGKPGWDEYKRRTSVLLPLPPKKH